MGRYSQSKKVEEPSEPSLSLSGVVQLQTQKTLRQSEQQMQIPGPHLPKSSNDYVKRSTLSQVNRKRRAKMQREELVYEVGETERKAKEQPPQMGGGEKGRKKKISYNLKN